MKLAAIIVTYYPERDLIRNIKSFIDDVELLIIWENTPSVDRQNHKVELPEYSDKIVHMGTGNNEGLGYAYNEGVKYAKSFGYSHIMTMDQDSYFIDFVGFKNNIAKETDQKVGILSPPYNMSAVYDWKPMDCKCAIQSGCVFSLQMLDEIGLFKSDFFIDNIDIEINYRARKYGYKSLHYGGCNMVHAFGKGRVVKIGKFQFSVSDYSALRLFYFARNTIFVMKEYPDEYSFQMKLEFFKRTVKTIIKIILGETDKIEKLTAMVKGFYYGIFSINKPYR